MIGSDSHMPARRQDCVRDWKWLGVGVVEACARGLTGLDSSLALLLGPAWASRCGRWEGQFCAGGCCPTGLTTQTFGERRLAVVSLSQPLLAHPGPSPRLAGPPTASEGRRSRHWAGWRGQVSGGAGPGRGQQGVRWAWTGETQT